MRRSNSPTLATVVMMALSPHAGATGGEMGPLVGTLVMYGMLVLFVIQLLTLATAAALPQRWPLGARWIVAILAPPLTLGCLYLVVALR